jgi:catechol 2,3-dioxygenase-like lactoylglutathione lyase family enzyme
MHRLMSMLQEVTPMSRLQLALNVADVEQAVVFYSKLFGTEPAKRRPGYANFAIADPPLKLVLMEVGADREKGTRGAVNHLGIEVGSADEVNAATDRLSREGLNTATEQATSCCYAVQDKVWVEDPDGAPWEIYTVLADEPDDASPSGNVSTGAACCAGTSVAANGAGACC